ncbi:MAG TPA: hypothetical protein PLK77_12820 [Pyrinomonadaceae bacterium]|nr:hypothetical protein [Pyrinomonadaceae bacterium]
MAKKERSIPRKIAHAAGWQLFKRGAKMLPFGGTAVAIILVGSDIKQKGVVNGVVNSAIDAIPFVGLAKNGIEIVRGRDFIPDKPEKEESKNGQKTA